MELGTKIKEIVKSRNITIKELSEISGVSLNTLYSITKRNNKTIRPDILIKMANALEISPWEILDIDENIALDKIFNHDIGTITLDTEEREMYTEVFKLYGYPKKYTDFWEGIRNSPLVKTMKEKAFIRFQSFFLLTGHELTELESGSYEILPRDKEPVIITESELYTLFHNLSEYGRFTIGNLYNRKKDELN